MYISVFLFVITGGSFSLSRSIFHPDLSRIPPLSWKLMALLLSGSAVHIFKGIFIDPCRICTKSAQKKKKRKKGKKEKKRKKEKEKRSKKSKRYQITNFNIYSSKMLHSTFRSKIFLMSKEAHKTHFRSSQFLAAKGVFFVSDHALWKILL